MTCDNFWQMSDEVSCLSYIKHICHIDITIKDSNVFGVTYSWCPAAVLVSGLRWANNVLLHLHTHTSCPACAWFHALAHPRHATLVGFLLHLHRHVMLVDEETKSSFWPSWFWNITIKNTVNITFHRPFWMKARIQANNYGAQYRASPNPIQSSHPYRLSNAIYQH